MASFSLRQNLYAVLVNREFGEGTKNASINFQRLHNLQPDGVVDYEAIGVAMTLGLGIIDDDMEDKSSQSWP
jgi:hypothetical protein